MMADFHISEQLSKHIEDVLLITVIELLSGFRKCIEEGVENPLSYYIKVNLGQKRILLGRKVHIVPL
jgi:hypothetical protein